MHKLIDYIFVNTQPTEVAVKNIKKVLRSQEAFSKKVVKLNNRVAYLTLLIFAYTFMVENYIREQNKKIDILSKDIEELKRMKGD